MKFVPVPAAPDFVLRDHGSISLLYPLTTEAVHWCADYLPADAMRFGSGIAIEHRYVNDIAIGITGDGLTVAA